MARVDTLEHYLTDVADAIRTATGDSSSISADSFDTEISNISVPSISVQKFSLNNFQGVRDTDYDLTFIDTSKMTDFSQTLSCGYYNSYMRSIDISTWNFTGATTLSNFLYGRGSTIVKFPTNVQVCNNITSIASFYWNNNGFHGELNLDFLSINNANLDASYAFGSNQATKISIKNIYKIKNASWMFYGATACTEIDMRNLDPSTITNTSNMFGPSAGNGPPDDCHIIVKDAAAKTWFQNNFSRFTNVVTVDEL